MGVAACLVSLLLASLGLYVDLAASTSKPNAIREQSLTVYIKRDKADPKSDLAPGNQAVGLRLREDDSVTENATARQEVFSVSPAEPPPDEQSTMDWHELITTSVAAIGHEKRRQDEIRSSMWQQTHSVMFQPANEFVPNEPDPIIPDFKFKPRVKVAGLGLTIGSCFIGIPLVGVPVEERTVAMTFVVCGQD